MIFERTMMFGFTLRNDIPTSSRMPTLASVILAWIQRLKYFAKKMHAISANSADRDDHEPDVGRPRRRGRPIHLGKEYGQGGDHGASSVMVTATAVVISWKDPSRALVQRS